MSSLICGFILFDDLGNPLLIDASEDYLSRQDFFTMVIETIYLYRSRILKQKLNTLHIGDHYLYIGFLGGFILVVISNTRNDRLTGAISDVLENIVKTGYEPSLIFSNIVARERIKRIISTSLSMIPLHASRIVELARKIMLHLEYVRNRRSIDIDALLMSREDVEADVIAPKYVHESDVSIDGLLDMYFSGRFEMVVRLAPNIFILGDLPKILYVKALLNLLEREDLWGEYTIGMARSVVENVEDSTARRYLRMTMGLFLSFGFLLI